MPVFEYRGLNRSGSNVRGTIDADNMRSARAKLKKEGVYVSEIKDKTREKKNKGAKKKSSNKSVNTSDLSMMTRQLATLIRSNIPLVDSLGAVAEQVDNPVLAENLSEMRDMVNEGSSFNKALIKYPNIYNKIFVSMCEAGEMSGTLDVILIRLAEFTEAQNELQSKVRSAMLYPLLMGGFSMILLAVLFVFVIPKMMVVFNSTPELTLPWYTELVIGISNFLIEYWVVIIATIVLTYFVFRNWKRSEKGRPQYDALLLKLPIVGPLVRTIAVSRFTRTLSTLLTGGVPMLSAMGIVRNVVNNETLARAIDDARDNISEGETIAGPLKKSGQFPPIVIHMIKIGEKTGELEHMLSQVSDSYDFQVKVKIEGMTSLLEPLMIIFMGFVIGVIVFAIMVPMFEMSNLGG